MRMRTIHLLLALCMLAYACSPSKKTLSGNKDSVSSPVTDNAVNDGSSFEKAIVISKNNESAGVAAEYAWLRENYPGYTSQGQSLNHHNKKSYDIIHILTKDGIKKDIYFDITKFFGKF